MLRSTVDLSVDLGSDFKVTGSGLDEAISRPGRCLSELHFGRLVRDEARRWLGEEPPMGHDFSLAELFAIRRRESPAPGRDDAHAGLYP